MRKLGRVARTDGTIEDITYAVVPGPDQERMPGSIVYTDFRTSDGAPLVLGPGEVLEVDAPPDANLQIGPPPP